MTTSGLFDTLLLLALPASGKSEVRHFMRNGGDEKSEQTYHLGDTVQLDDFPYVHFLRMIDEHLEALGKARIFYANEEASFTERRDWGTLLQLVNQDYIVMTHLDAPTPPAGADHLFDRIDQARTAVGAATVFDSMDTELRSLLADRLSGEADRLNREIFGRRPSSLNGKTIVIEFARGGPDGASMPLPTTYGYAYAFSQLSEAILERAAVLYIWVTPEESRRKNRARANPDDPGSILNHMCPEDVMINEYGSCDMEHLLETSDKSGTVTVDAHGRRFHLPLARFDNREDLTTFVRDDDEWQSEDVNKLEGALSDALARLWETYETTRG